MIDYDIEQALDKLAEGDFSSVYIAYCGISSGNPYLARKTATILQQQTRNLSSNHFIRMEEQFRECTSLNWYVDWKQVKPLEYLNGFSSKEEKAAVCRLGTFHPNGYFRETCLNLLVLYDDALPFMILRMNDWVGPVREYAFSLAEQRIKKCGIEEILVSMAYLYKIQYCQRRNSQRFQNFMEKIKERLEQDLASLNKGKIADLDYKAKKMTYQLLFDYKIVDIQEIPEMLARERFSFCKQYIISRVLNEYICPDTMIEEFLKNKNSQVRYYAIQYLYKVTNGVWKKAEDFLLDSSRKIRMLVQFILRKQGKQEFAAYYADHLEGEKQEAAILGLGEAGDKQWSYLLLPFLDSDKLRIVKAALSALYFLLKEEGKEIYVRFLSSSNLALAKTAFKIMLKQRIIWDSARIYKEFLESEEDWRKEMYAKILLNGAYWDMLSYAITLCCDQNQNIRQTAYSEFNRRKQVFTTPTAHQREHAWKALIMQQSILPKWIEREVRFQLEHS